jgi:predicted peptidase
MAELSRRHFLSASVVLAPVIGLYAGRASAQSSGGGFSAASARLPGSSGKPKTPGPQSVTAVCEVTGGGQKVYAIAVEYDVDIDPSSLASDSYSAAVTPAPANYFPGMPDIVDKNDTSEAPQPRSIRAIYTNDVPALRGDQTSVAGRYVVLEFPHDPNLSLPTQDSESVTVSQLRDIRTVDGAVYSATDKGISNRGQRGLNVAIRGVDDWEQSHWWWDDERATYLEYSLYLPKSFLAKGGEEKAYPLVLAITHSGTSYDGTCKETLTETCIASIWGMPEEQETHECVVITPRYERTTMNDYWEHTHDVENTHRLEGFGCAVIRRTL